MLTRSDSEKPAEHVRTHVQAQCGPSPGKNWVTFGPALGWISVVTRKRTDTTLDHSQKAEKV